MRGWRSVPVVAALVANPTTFGLEAAAPRADAPVAAQRLTAESDGERFVGTYRLLRTETKDPSGKWTPTPNFNSIGYITYSDTGYMAVHIMPKDRPRFAGTQPTAEEALKAIQGYSAYYGPYVVDEKGKFVVHKRSGQLNPGGIVDAKRYYDFVGNQLILTPGDNGLAKDQATRHLIWERLPNVPLSAEARKFIGFRKLLYTDRYAERDGKVLRHGERNETRSGSVIIYTPTGHMMVHLMAREGRTRYAGTSPTPDEALAVYRSYGGYFGRFTVHEEANPRYVIHHQEGTLNPAGGMDAQRFYQLDGNVLRLGGPPTTANGETTGGHLYWELMPPLRNGVPATR